MDKDDYEVGYRKPPKQYQFQKGVGGRKGRRERNMKTELQELLGERITLKKGRKVTIRYALVAKLRQMALQGDIRAIAKLIDLGLTFEQDDPSERCTPLDRNDRTILKAFDKYAGTPLEYQRIELNELLESDFRAFAAKCLFHVIPRSPWEPNWFFKVLMWYLEQIRRKDRQRLIISMPPMLLKSYAASVALSAYALGRDPRARVLCVSNTAEKASFRARECLSVMTSSWYKELFPATRLAQEKRAAADFTTTAGGYRRIGSIGSSLDDRGADLMIVEDPMTEEDARSPKRRRAICEWFDNFLRTHVEQHPNATIVIVSSRLHQDDLTAHLLGKDEGWHEAKFPAIATEWKIQQMDQHGALHAPAPGDLLQPNQISKDALDEIRAQIGEASFEAQYQQAPIVDGSGPSLWDSFQFYDQAPESQSGDRIYHSWYLPPVSEETEQNYILTKWLVRDGNHYLLDLCRERLTFLQLSQRIKNHCDSGNVFATMLTDTPEGQSLYRDLASPWGRPNIFRVFRSGDLVTRLRIQSIPLEEGRIFLPGNAVWLDEVHAEVRSFAGNTDQGFVESLVQFLEGKRRFEAPSRDVNFGSS